MKKKSEKTLNILKKIDKLTPELLDKIKTPQATVDEKPSRAPKNNSTKERRKLAKNKAREDKVAKNLEANFNKDLWTSN